jgi:hypothetical protein
VEVTKRLKPSAKRAAKYGGSATVQAVTIDVLLFNNPFLLLVRWLIWDPRPSVAITQPVLAQGF